MPCCHKLKKKRTLTRKKKLEKQCGDRTCTAGVGPKDFDSGAGLGSSIISESIIRSP
jgi:hypothetical protein